MYVYFFQFSFRLLLFQTQWGRLQGMKVRVLLQVTRGTCTSQTHQHYSVCQHTLFWLLVFDALFLLLKYLPSGKLTILQGCCLQVFFIWIFFCLDIYFSALSCLSMLPLFFPPEFPCLYTLREVGFIFCFHSFYFGVSASHFPHTFNFYWLCSFCYPYFHHPKAFFPPYYHSSAKQNSSFQTKLVNTLNNTGERNLCYITSVLLKMGIHKKKV